MKDSLRMIRLALLCGLAAALAASCSLYRRYERNPGMEALADSLYLADLAPRSDTLTLADWSWTSFFRDSHLQELIREGLAGNTDLAMAGLRVTEAQARLQAARMAFLPTLSLSPRADADYRDGNAATGYDALATAGWEPDLFGRKWNDRRAAAASLAAAEADGQSVRTALVASIADAYYTLLMLDDQLAVSERTLSNWEEHLRVQRALKKTGRATEMAVAQSEAGKASVEASAEALRLQIRQTENALCSLLGRPAGPVARSADADLSAAVEALPQEWSVGVPVQLLRTRPQVVSREASLAQAFHVAQEARGALYPSLTLSGSAGWTSQGVTLTSPAAFIATATASLLQPVLSGGRLRANRAVAEAQCEEALLAFRQSLLDAGEEVNDALAAWQSSARKAETDRRRVASLESAVRSAELLMQHSSASYLDVLVARQSLLSAELNLLTDRYQQIHGAISLYHALGGGRF